MPGNRSYGEGLQSSFKSLAASIYRVEAGYENNSCRRNKLVGKCDSTVVNMEGCNVKCLIDSGSAVSIIPISEAKRIGIEKLKKAEWLKITCVNQEVIEYLGYFETDIKIFGKLVKKVGFLVSKNDRLKVVGMNILNKLPEYRSEKMTFRKNIQENTCNRNQHCVKIGVNEIEVEIIRDRQWMDELVYGGAWK